MKISPMLPLQYVHGSKLELGLRKEFPWLTGIHLLESKPKQEVLCALTGISEKVKTNCFSILNLILYSCLTAWPVRIPPFLLTLQIFSKRYPKLTSA